MIALPGSPAYALNHGVYFTDSQVVPLGTAELAGVAFQSHAFGSPLSWS